ncbi:MAG: hypothetical protein HY696_00155 [Deltaproteobacteria bacterium]|nr:hypothetical protein [Deltaproteobacteria bacterium]
MTTAIAINVQEVCQRAFALLGDRQFSDAERLLANCLTKIQDPVGIALLHSALGVCAKCQGKGKIALQHYQRAEKILPEDPALKLITAQLLIDEFAQYDQAVRRCRKAALLVPQNPVVLHHALTLEGMAYARRGDRRRAGEMLTASMVHDFKGFVTTRNIDFQLVHYLLRKEWHGDLCRHFIERAHAFARSVKEGGWIRTLKRMLEALPAADHSHQAEAKR